MAKERLSKLQKWILVQSYKGTYALKWSAIQEYDLTKRAIYEHYFRVKINKQKSFESKFKCDEPLGNKPVILSRSIRKLKERGYIESEAKWFIRDQWGLKLTDAGKRKVEEILSKEPILLLR